MFVLFLHLLFLLVALAITFGLNWLASIIPASVFQEFGQFVVPAIAVVSTFLVALTDDFGEMKPTPKPKYLTRAILIGLVCFGAWYFFSHLRYTSEVVSELKDDYENPKQELYVAYEEEFGVSGFLGYLLWSAKAGAHISIEDDDVEYADFDLPRGWSSFVVNWGKRLVNLFLVMLWVTKSYNYLKQEPPSRPAVSRASTTKPTSTSGTRRNAQAYLERGVMHRKQGDQDGAIADLTEALRLNPALVVAYTNRGYARWEKGDQDGAIADYTEAIRLDPTLIAAYSSRGNLFQEKGDLDRAIADYTEALHLDSTDKLLYIGRGNARRKQGDHEGAIADLNEAIRLDPGNAVAYTNRGTVRREKGDYDEAIADYTEAIRLDPADKWPYYRRAFARRATGDQDGAIADYTEAIRLDTAFAPAYSERGDARRAKGDLDGAIADNTEALRLNSAFAMAYTNRGVARYQKGDHEGAIADFTEALRLDPDDVVARAFVRKAKGDSDAVITDQTDTTG